MKKFGKFMVTVLSIAAFAGSAYYLVKNVINKDSSDDFDDFEDEFDDFDFNDEGEADTPGPADNREYVTLNITKEDAEAPVAEATEADAEETTTEIETVPTEEVSGETAEPTEE